MSSDNVVEFTSEGPSNNSSSHKEAEELHELMMENSAKIKHVMIAFDSPSEFMKRLVTMELWGLTLNKEPVTRVMESTKDAIKNWKPPDKIVYKTPDLKEETNLEFSRQSIIHS